MRPVVGVVGVCVTALGFAAGCSSSLDRANAAYLKSDWTTAASSYERALADSSSPTDIEFIQTRLADSRTRATDELLNRSRLLESSGDLKGAWREAEKAAALGDSTASAERLGELRPKYGAMRLESARAALGAGRVDEAVRHLRDSVAAHPTPEAESLLASASTEAERLHGEQALASMSDGLSALDAMDWPRAKAAFERAESLVPGTAPRELEFASSMSRAERDARSGAFVSAKARFEQAILTGVRPDVARSQMRKLVPLLYDVTVHSAVILPFKPQSHRPWDGIGGPVSGAGRALTYLAGLSGPAGFAMEGVAQGLAEGALSAIEPPDCALHIAVDGILVASGQVQKDEMAPRWNSRFQVSASTADARTVQFLVTDIDALDHDNVGDARMRLGDLVAVEGPKSWSFIGEDAALAAGGIVALHVSVTSVEAAATARSPTSVTQPPAPTAPRPRNFKKH